MTGVHSPPGGVADATTRIQHWPGKRGATVSAVGKRKRRAQPEDANEHFDEELRWVKIPKGAKRSASHGTPGYERDLLRDGETNDLLGPSESRPADPNEFDTGHDDDGDDDSHEWDFRTHDASDRQHEQEPSQWAQLLADLIVLVATDPRVEQVVRAKLSAVYDGAKSFLARRRTRRAPREATPAPWAHTHGSSVTPATDSETARTGPVQPISADAYRATLAAIIAAEQFAAEHRERLARVEVVDDEIPDRLAAGLRLVLDGRSAELDDELRSDLLAFLLVDEGDGDRYRLVAVDESSQGPEPQRRMLAD